MASAHDLARDGADDLPGNAAGAARPFAGRQGARGGDLAPLVIAAVAGRWGLAGGISLAAGFAALAGAWVWTLPETAGARIEV